MKWKKEYEVGDQLIDKQHKELIKIINKFNKTISDKSINTYKEIGETIKYLINYTVFHFDYEEGLMARIKYPNLQEHKKIHREIIGKIKNILNKFKQKEPYTPIEFYYFLSDWLNNHILNNDLKIKKYIIKADLVNSIKKAEEYNHYYALEVIEPNLKKLDLLYDALPRKIDFLKSFFNSYKLEDPSIHSMILDTMDYLALNKIISKECLLEVKKEIEGTQTL